MTQGSGKPWQLNPMRMDDLMDDLMDDAGLWEAPVTQPNKDG